MWILEFKGLRVFSSKWEAAYSLYQIHPYPLPVKRKSVTPCMLNYGKNIFFFRDGYCIVKQWKKSTGYRFVPECNHAQEIHLCTGNSYISISCLHGLYNLEKVLNV